MIPVIMIPVILESPYRCGDSIARAYRQACIRDCLARGETPYASHQMLTDALDDSVPEQRAEGMKAGFEMHKVIKKSVVYMDLMMSPGMKEGIEHAKSLGNQIVYRYIGQPWCVVEPHEYRAEDAIL